MHLGFGYIPVQLELVVLAVRWFSGRDMPEKFVNLHEELDKVILETAQIADKMGLAVCMSDEPARKAFIGAPPQFRGIRQQAKIDKDYDVFVCAYAEILSEGQQVHSCGFDAASQRARYTSLLWYYGVKKANERYMSDNGDPPRLRKSVFKKIDASAIVTLE
ncbi:hypothetical protein FXO38_06735 [Capsicum annuum]|uniref:Uncharacterized protein n=1 Tax=Capsicum annuum TaxID=4072 RepID=A0A2G2ZSK6_CAPAN|nr:hypothetical protein FXO38_06735 [Capsicum annuum]PHT84933.1 hypothetical protein T459_13376 [Capsicum annuum]